MALGRYRGVLRACGVPRLVGAMVVGRLPNGMRPLGIVLVVHQHHDSYATSGAALAALMVGTTVSAPFRGRAVDRWGQFWILHVLASLQTLSLAGFVLAAGRHAAGVVMVLAALMGATSSTLGGSMRALWPIVISSREDLQAAYALQALLEDLIFIAGPLAASLLLAVASPTAILVVSGVSGLVGTVGFASAPASRSTTGRPGERTGSLGALGAPGMQVLVLTLACTGAVIGVLDVAVPALATADGDASAAGLLLAMLSSSSMVGGLCYGARAWKTKPGRRYLWLSGIFAAFVAPLPAADSLAELGALLILVGLAYAPSMISAYLLLDDLAPAGALTEAYTWLVSANAGGVAIGAALAGPTVQHAGIHWSLALAAGSAALGLTAALLRRRRLQAMAAAPVGVRG
jgi:MFS family permease